MIRDISIGILTIVEVVVIRRFWRFFLTCVLLLALLFQGVVRAGGAACGQSHAGQGQVLASSHAFLSDTLEVDIPSMPMASHQAHAMHHATLLADHQSAMDEQHHTAHDGASKDCDGRCGACCTGTVMFVNMEVLLSADASSQDFADFREEAASADVDRLDRPPQNILV